MPISNEKVEKALVLVGFSSHSAPSSVSVASPLPSVTAVAVIDQFTSPASVLFWGTNQDLAGPTQHPTRIEVRLLLLFVGEFTKPISSTPTPRNLLPKSQRVESVRLWASLSDAGVYDLMSWSRRGEAG